MTVAVPVDPAIALAGLAVGFTVGLTGMGGGALMTPILVLFFGVSPLAAVSSDLLVSLVMKPVGGAVHWSRGTVHRRLVAWLCVGSVPAALGGVLLLRFFGGDDVQGFVKRALGFALIVVAGAIGVRAFVQRRRHEERGLPEIAVRPLVTVLIGIAGGLIVGMTSVGSGSIMIVLLLLAYPALSTSQLVGTDLVQAVPLVGAAVLGHLFFGDVRLGLTASLLVGALPGVYAGARLSARASDRVVRPALFVVLLSSGLKLAGVV